MLDLRTACLLDKVNQYCREGGYRIFEEQELLDCFPEKLRVDRDGLAHSLRYLSENGYLDIRYSEEGLYCLCPLPQGRAYSENVRTARTEASRKKRENLLVVLLGAFFGGLIGGMAAQLLSVLF